MSPSSLFIRHFCRRQLTTATTTSAATSTFAYTTTSAATTTSDAATATAATTANAASLAAVFSHSETLPPILLPSEIQELVKRFKRNSKSVNFRRRLSHYEGIVRHLASKSHFSAISDILEHQKKYKETMSDEGFGVRLIMLYGKAGMFDHARKVFDELPQFNCPRTVMSFNALLCACVKSKNLEKVGELFEELPEKLEIKPDVVSYNTVIKGFCDSGDLDSALKVMEKMEEGEIGLNVVSFNTVLEVYYRENKLEEAEKLWERMEEKGVVANVRTYNSKLRWLVRNGEVEDALELVERMVSEEVNPDRFTYNAVIKGCAAKGKFQEAKMLFGKMAGDRCLPDHATYEMLVSFACEKGDVDFAVELCKQSVESNVSVHRSLMQLVVDTLIKRSKIEEANELVELVNSSKKHRYTLALPVSA